MATNWTNEYIATNDVKKVVTSIARSNCNRMHQLAIMMTKVRELQKAPEFDSRICSARSVEGLDEILDKLIYMFSCESNCDVVKLRAAVEDNPIMQTVIDYDKIEEDRHL